LCSDVPLPASNQPNRSRTGRRPFSWVSLPFAMSSFVTDGPAGPEGALPLTGERTIPGLAEENY